METVKSLLVAVVGISHVMGLCELSHWWHLLLGAVLAFSLTGLGVPGGHAAS